MQQILRNNTVLLDVSLVQYVGLVKAFLLFLLGSTSSTEISEYLVVKSGLVVQLLDENISICPNVFLQVFCALPLNFPPCTGKVQVGVHKLNQVENIVFCDSSRVDQKSFTNFWNKKKVKKLLFIN